MKSVVIAAPGRGRVAIVVDARMALDIAMLIGVSPWASLNQWDTLKRRIRKAANEAGAKPARKRKR